jgi:hypothetical protein
MVLPRKSAHKEMATAGKVQGDDAMKKMIETFEIVRKQSRITRTSS